MTKLEEIELCLMHINDIKHSVNNLDYIKMLDDIYYMVELIRDKFKKDPDMKNMSHQAINKINEALATTEQLYCRYCMN